MDTQTSINIYTDGGARGNPGPAALGIYIEDSSGKPLGEIGEYIGETTNNIAEYSAVLKALEWVSEHKSELPSLSTVNFFLDSQLVVFQLGGQYKIKNEGLRKLYEKIRALETQLQLTIGYTHIPREKNKKADRMVNVALDNLK